MNPKVSIIVPVYNAENYLDECIQSILAQDLTNWELILINDGSKDRSLEICRRYEAQDARIDVLDGPNMGVSAARNRGLEAAQGEYIGFVDADDFIAPQMYSKLAEKIESEKVDIMFCTCAEWTNGQTRISKRLGAGEDKVCTGKEALLNMIQSRGETCWHSLYQRELLEKNQIRFLPQRKYAEDAEFLCICLMKAKWVGFCSDVLYYYRMEGQNTLEHYMPTLEQDAFAYTSFLLELIERDAELSQAREKVLKFRAKTLLYAIYNVCKKGTPIHSWYERVRYARELAERPEYQEALDAALRQENSLLLKAEFWAVKHRLDEIPVWYYSWFKPLMAQFRNQKKSER